MHVLSLLTQGQSLGITFYSRYILALYELIPDTDATKILLYWEIFAKNFIIKVHRPAFPIPVNIWLFVTKEGKNSLLGVH